MPELRTQLAKKALETQGHQGSTNGGGWITSFCAGKTIESFLKDGQDLILRFTDGHEARIGWQDGNGNKLPGDPYLVTLDVRILVGRG